MTKVERFSAVTKTGTSLGEGTSASCWGRVESDDEDDQITLFLVLDITA